MGLGGRGIAPVAGLLSQSRHAGPISTSLECPRPLSMFPVPTSVFLTRGVGVHRDRLHRLRIRLARCRYRAAKSCSSHRLCRRDAMGSPPPRASKRCAPARLLSVCWRGRKPTSRGGASMRDARDPRPSRRSGRLWLYFRYHGFGKTEQESSDYAEDLAATMLATTLGIDFDPDAAWNERRRVYETSGHVLR